MITRAKAGVFKPRYRVDMASTALLLALFAALKPRGFKLAAKSPQWLASMQEEIDALRSNNTWNLVPRPPEMNIVGSKWVFCIKFRSYDSIECHNARLVA